jgi:prephenate dehydrogenase
MRIAVIGTGLVGGSIGLACMQRGHEVVGFDRDRECSARALELGAIGRIAPSAMTIVQKHFFIIGVTIPSDVPRLLPVVPAPESRLSGYPAQSRISS